MSSGSRCNFPFRAGARSNMWTSPSSTAACTSSDIPLLYSKGQPQPPARASAAPQPSLFLPKASSGSVSGRGKTGWARGEGRARGVLHALTNPADHFPQVKYILKCPSLTLLIPSHCRTCNNCFASTLEKICLEIQIYQLPLCPR